MTELRAAEAKLERKVTTNFKLVFQTSQENSVWVRKVKGL